MSLWTVLMRLTGGFSAPKLAAVLNETGYLTSASKDATFRRLLETTLFVLDVCSNSSAQNDFTLTPLEGHV